MVLSVALFRHFATLKLMQMNSTEIYDLFLICLLTKNYFFLSATYYVMLCLDKQ